MVRCSRTPTTGSLGFEIVAFRLAAFGSGRAFVSAQHSQLEPFASEHERIPLSIRFLLHESPQSTTQAYTPQVLIEPYMHSPKPR